MTFRTLKPHRVLNPGQARGKILKLEEPLSFWGGFDPKDGKILDRNHPQAGENISGTVLALPGSRGSAGTPAGLAESLRSGAGPSAVLLPKADVNLTIGAQVAATLYNICLPVWIILPEDFNDLETGFDVSINADISQ